MFRDSLLRKIMMGLIVAEGDDDGGGGGNGGEGGVPEWAKDLPESVQGWDEVKNSDTSEKFYDQMANQRSRMGRSITIPGEDAGEDQWKTFNDKVMNKVPTLMLKPDLENTEAMDMIYGSLGRPEKAEDYVVPEIEGMDMSEAEVFRPVAHKFGLNPTQFNGVVNAITEGRKAEGEAALAANVEAHKELKTEWGADYDRRMSVATQIAKLTDAPEGLYQMLKEGRGAPSDYKWLHEIATRFKGEGKDLLEDKNETEPSMTPDEADVKIQEIRGNKQHAYWNKADPGHKLALTKMMDLQRLKQGTTKG